MHFVGRRENIVFITGLFMFRRILGSGDSRSVLLIIISTVISISEPAWIRFEYVHSTLSVISNILYLIGIYRLWKSEIFPPRAVKGAFILFISFLVYIAGNIATFVTGAFLPQASSYILLVAIAAVSVMNLAGWYRIKTTDRSVT